MNTRTNPATSTTVASASERRLPLVLLAAFSLSLAHTVYASIAGLSSPDFTLTTPTTWVFYALGFASVAVARVDARWAHRTLATYLALVLAVALFYYPTTFEPRQQTTFGWFENDVYTGLLILAGYLAVDRVLARTRRPLGR